jgi:hypothetical protein
MRLASRFFICYIKTSKEIHMAALHEMSNYQLISEVISLRESVDWYRDRVVWGFYEENEPEYYQGKEGESEICDPVTAEEVTNLLNNCIKLEKELDKVIDALIWCSGSADFQEGGVAREGWLKVCAPLIKKNRV